MCLQVDYKDLLGGLRDASKELNVQPVPAFIDKCIQLYETTLVRHGLMLVGPTMGGKTSCWRALQKVGQAAVFGRCNLNCSMAAIAAILPCAACLTYQ